MYLKPKKARGIICICLLFLLFSAPVFGQTSIKSSLEYVLANENLSDGDRVMTMRRLAHHLFFSYQILDKTLTIESFHKALPYLKNETDVTSSRTRPSIYPDKKRLKYVILAVVALLALSFLYIAYRQRSKALAQQARVQQLEIDAIKQQHKVSLLSAMIDGQENERTRLARDLHDGLGGLLSGIKIELSGATSLVEKPNAHSLLQKTLERLDHAVDELRRIARSMMPELLLKYGLGEAIQEYCLSLKRTGINITCQIIKYKNTLEENKQIVIYRIVQELISNAIKHAQASQILVQLQQQENKLFLTVEDDGIGFNNAEIELKKSSGLANIKARVAFLNGRMDIDSRMEEGTTINIECILE